MELTQIVPAPRGAHAVGLIRCEGHDEKGRPCRAILEVPLNDKGECPLCGWKVRSYSAHLAARSVEK